MYLDSAEQHGLETRLLQHDHLILAVPSPSSWAKSPPTSLEDLKNADFVGGFRSALPVYYGRMMAHFARLQFEPRVVQHGADNITILSIVAAGLGIAIFPAASSSHPTPGIRFLQLEELTACDKIGNCCRDADP
ncbi:LysR family substrate-binding domain-containing protein [Halomonas rituensis]|uniref:LysR family substrate-binding domain-containing protein n=1 Tax=Vreelandella rituensis TaxID=2282306 RepID=UPI001F319576